MKDLPLMSLKEARKLLGKEAQDMNDEQVMQVILVLTDTARERLQNRNIRSKRGK